MILLLSFMGCASTPTVELEAPVEPIVELSPIPSTGELPVWSPLVPEVFELSNGGQCLAYRRPSLTDAIHAHGVRRWGHS